jgi:hypothetical protein
MGPTARLWQRSYRGRQPIDAHSRLLYRAASRYVLPAYQNKMSSKHWSLLNIFNSNYCCLAFRSSCSPETSKQQPIVYTIHELQPLLSISFLLSLTFQLTSALLPVQIQEASSSTSTSSGSFPMSLATIGVKITVGGNRIGEAALCAA